MSKKVLEKDLCCFLVSSFPEKSDRLKGKREVVRKMRVSQQCADDVAEDVIKILSSVKSSLDEFNDLQLADLLFLLKETEKIKFSNGVNKEIKKVKDWQEWGTFISGLKKKNPTHIGVEIYL